MYSIGKGGTYNYFECGVENTKSVTSIFSNHIQQEKIKG